jgi:hypothetical protein
MIETTESVSTVTHPFEYITPVSRLVLASDNQAVTQQIKMTCSEDLVSFESKPLTAKIYTSCVSVGFYQYSLYEHFVCGIAEFSIPPSVSEYLSHNVIEIHLVSCFEQIGFQVSFNEYHLDAEYCPAQSI